MTEYIQQNGPGLFDDISLTTFTDGQSVSIPDYYRLSRPTTRAQLKVWDELSKLQAVYDGYGDIGDALHEALKKIYQGSEKAIVEIADFSDRTIAEYEGLRYQRMVTQFCDLSVQEFALHSRGFRTLLAQLMAKDAQRGIYPEPDKPSFWQRHFS